MQECEFYSQRSGGVLFFSQSPDMAASFDSEKEAENYAGLKGLTWVWAVRADLIEEWKVGRVLRGC